MKIPRGTHPTGPDAANDVDIPAPRVPWVAADPLGIDGAERLYAHLLARQQAAGYAELDRLSEVGSIVEPRPIRRRYGRSLLGLIGIVALVLGGAAVIYGARGEEPTPRTWHLLTQTYGGTVSLIKDLTERECRFAYNRALGNPATDVEIAAAKERQERLKQEDADRRAAWLIARPWCNGLDLHAVNLSPECSDHTPRLTSTGTRMISPGDISKAECFE